MTKDAYAEYLQSPEWLERRRLVMQRADDLCERCKSRQATQVHHLTYERVGHEWLADLIALCRECHDMEHDEEFQAHCRQLTAMTHAEVCEWLHLPVDTTA